MDTTLEEEPDEITAIITLQVKVTGIGEHDYHAAVSEMFDKVKEVAEVLEAKVERVPNYSVN